MGLPMSQSSGRKVQANKWGPHKGLRPQGVQGGFILDSKELGVRESLSSRYRLQRTNGGLRVLKMNGIKNGIIHTLTNLIVTRKETSIVPFNEIKDGASR